MSRKAKTAAELMAELQNDPEFRRRELETEQKRLLNAQKYAEFMGPTLARLREAGFAGSSLHEIVKMFAPLPSKAVEILISALNEVSEYRGKEAIVRALAAASAPFDGGSLVKCFEGTSDEALRWTVLNTVASVHPHSIDVWLSKIRSTSYGDTLRDLT